MKRALLIGVRYEGEDTLKGPHKDVAAMKQLLITRKWCSQRLRAFANEL